jgi:aminopeptidase-like protein
MNDILNFCKDLFLIYRSITGSGVLLTLEYIQKYIPLKIKSFDSGVKCFDWTIPNEWNIEDAYVIDLKTNKKIIDFKNHNLHIVGYSIPMNEILSYDELIKHLYFLEDQPDAIPYITSYYKSNWGFCLTYHSFLKINKSSTFHVVIKSKFDDKGKMYYGELVIPGESSKEILISSYICHPQMANNELSGPAVLTFLAKHLLINKNKYTYRFILIPETIGSIAYLSIYKEYLIKNVIGGFVITCVGDERAWGYIPSRNANTISDKIAKHVLLNYTEGFQEYSWLDRGSDERQFCAPGIDLPISSITRSKYATYPEYHTSLDDFRIVTKKGLEGSLEIYKKCIFIFEKNIKPKINVFCEPQLGKRGLYPNISTKNTRDIVKNMMNIISYCDGTFTLLEISELCDVSFIETVDIIEKLKQSKLIDFIN